MTYSILPLTDDPWQVFTLDLTINGAPFHAQVEIRYLPARRSTGHPFMPRWRSGTCRHRISGFCRSGIMLPGRCWLIRSL